MRVRRSRSTKTDVALPPPPGGGRPVPMPALLSGAWINGERRGCRGGSSAVEFATIMGRQKVDHALGLAAAAGRFDEHDLGAILDHLAIHGNPGDLVRADEAHSAQPGTGAWTGFGR